MDVSLLIMRLVHILLGVFWAGAVLFNTIFLLPAMRDAGPEGAKVGAALMRRRLFDVLPTVAVLNILSGFWLYWRVSLGFQPEYMGSTTGMTLGFGAIASLIAFGIGVFVMRPAMLRAAALTQSAAQADPSVREAQLKTVQSLRVRAGKKTATSSLWGS